MLHLKSPAIRLGISHIAPSFLLSAKSHALLACSVVNALAAARCRYQLFAGTWVQITLKKTGDLFCHLNLTRTF